MWYQVSGVCGGEGGTMECTTAELHAQGTATTWRPRYKSVQGGKMN